MSKQRAMVSAHSSAPRSIAAWLLCSTALTLLGPNAANANPLNGQVAAGSATITQSGSNKVNINQQSQKAVINWQSFSISSGETTNFNQPNASAVTLNRVTGVDPSSIMGNLTANGQVWLINPNGIAFGKSARVDVAGLLATTIDIANQDFMAGNYRFTGLKNPGAMVTNAGQITVRDAGLAALVAPGVENSGVIQANLGQIQLSSTAAFTVDLYGDGLFNFTLDKQVTQAIAKPDGTKPSAAVTNTGKLIADGGKILLTANAARSVVDHAINMDGLAQATSANVATNGDITLDGGSEGSVEVSGTLDASGKASGQTGGTVQVTGSDVNVASTAKIDVSGDAGGGTVLIGGDLHGGGPLRHADATTVESGATINADALSKGNGGHVVVWSDDQTQFNGAISAKGGAAGGDAGSAEVSSHGRLGFNGNVDLLAPYGEHGTLLLDPQDVTIGDTGSWIVTVASLQSALANGDVLITTNNAGTDAGDITVAQNVSWAGSSSLTLSANRNIIVQDSVTIANNGSGSLSLHADNEGVGTGSVLFDGSGKVNWSNSSGIVSIFYDPASGYRNPTNFLSNVIGANGRMTAYMLVNTAAELQGVNSNLSGAYALGKDISLAGVSNFTPIGSGDTHTIDYFPGYPNTINAPFEGIFNGDGHVIDSLTITLGGVQNIGLFGYIGQAGKVLNVGLTNIHINGKGDNYLANIGGLAGTNDGTIDGSYVTGVVSGTGDSDAVGGLVGYNDGTITGSHSTATVSGGDTVGGLVGINGLYWASFEVSSSQVGTISESYATGSVTGIPYPGSANDTYKGDAVGGLVGINDAVVPCGGKVTCRSAVIDQSFATGAVNGGGFNNVGGLIGVNNGSLKRSYALGAVTNNAIGESNNVGALVGLENDPDEGFNIADTTATISQSYAVGRVVAPDSQAQIAGVGGLVGLYGGAPGTAATTILNSYWDIQSTGQTVSGGGIGRTTAQLQGSLPPGFDSSIWTVGSNGYPQLRWYLASAPTSPSILAPVASSQLVFIEALIANPLQISPSLNISDTTPETDSEWATRNEAGIQAVENNPDVQADIRSLALAIQAAQGGDAAEIGFEITADIAACTQGFYDLTHGQILIGSLELINFSASFLQDQIAAKFHVYIPSSDLTNLAGAIAGAYLTGFALGK